MHKNVIRQYLVEEITRMLLRNTVICPIHTRCIALSIGVRDVSVVCRCDTEVPELDQRVAVGERYSMRKTLDEMGRETFS